MPVAGGLLALLRGFVVGGGECLAVDRGHPLQARNGIALGIEPGGILFPAARRPARKAGADDGGSEGGQLDLHRDDRDHVSPRMQSVNSA